MTKKIHLIIFLLIVISFKGNTTHISGADFSYQCVGQDSFYVTLNLFRDCTGIKAPVDAEVKFESTCGSNFKQKLIKQNGIDGTEISQLCPNSIVNSTCNGGALPGMQQHIYAGIVVMSPKCDTWTMSWELCCRNTTINVVGQPRMAVSATMNSVSDSCNNSPVFNAQPILYVCRNRHVDYNFGVTESDGDSFVYSFIDPLDRFTGGVATPVNFQAGYSYTQPIAGITLNTTSGQLSFTPTISGNFILAVQVCEYDYATGALLGCIVRDIQLVVFTCTNVPPQAPLGGISNFSGTGQLVAPDSVEVCIGNDFTFDLVFTDANVGDSITLTTNIDQVIPGATYTIVNGNPATITVSGTVSTNLASLTTFMVTAMDDACPIPASSIVGYNIITRQLPTVATVNVPLTCADDVPVAISGTVVNASGGVWSGGLGSFTGANSLINNAYTPTAAEVLSGSVNLFLTTTGTGNCASVQDQLILSFTDFSAVITESSTDVICNGGNTGTATVVMNGGVSPFAAVWSTTPVQTGLSASNLPIGAYQVTITDANGCDSVTSVTVIEPAVLSSTPTILSHVNCKGGNTGSAIVSPVGGVVPYSYLWDANALNQTTATATKLVAGTFSVTITDAVGCITVNSVTITEPVSPLTLVTTSQDISCFGLTDGEATATPAGGTLPYNYTWVGGQITPAITNLSANSYSVTVTDNNGFCIAKTGIFIVEPGKLTSLDSVVNVSCFGGTDGDATIQVTGGVTPYTYQWGAGAFNQTTKTVTGLIQGNYVVTVTDSNGCVFDTSVTITQPIALQLSSANVDVTCFNGIDGEVSVSPSGGTAPYRYLWDVNANSQTDSVANALSQGSYSVTVTDTNDCLIDMIVSTNHPAKLTVNGIQKANALCYDDTNGFAKVTVTGGIAPYQYSWNAAAYSQTTPKAKSLGAGTFVVTITDTNGCFFDTAITITQPALALSLNDSVTNALCFGDSNGIITLNTIGGTTPYSFQWDSLAGYAILPQVTGLAMGNYSVSVTDANGCLDSLVSTVTQPLAALTISTEVSDVLCFSDSTGFAKASVLGGTSPYQYQWDVQANSQRDTLAISLFAGSYSVTVTDTNGCQIDTLVTVNEPNKLTMTDSTSKVSCFGGADGQATVSVSGGVAPYVYQWAVSAHSRTIATATGLNSGTHQIVIIDSNACVLDTLVTIHQPLAPLFVISDSLPVSCFGGNDGKGVAQISGGTAPYSSLWTGVNVSQSADTAINLIIGNYTLVVTDSNGCKDTSAITVTEPTLLVASETNNTSVGCFGDSTGSATVLGSGGIAPYGYQWPVTASSQDSSFAISLAMGSYQVSVTDSNNCLAIINVIITQPTDSLATSILEFDASCFGLNDGVAVVSAIGGTSPYRYMWSANCGSQSSDTASALLQDMYRVMVTDSNGCVSRNLAVISEPLPLSFSAVTNVPVNCYAGKDGTSTLTVIGGTNPYNYWWDSTTGNQTNSTAYQLSNGNYAVTVTDLNGCIIDTIVTITQPAGALDLSVSTTPVNCFAGSDGAAIASVTGGTNPYIVNWGASSGNQTGLNASNLQSGTYVVIVTDSNGCLDTNYVDITEPQAALSLTTSSVDVSCYSFSDGNVSVLSSGGTIPYTYLWDANTGSQTNSNAINLSASNYWVTITDNNGCQDSISVNLHQPNPISLTVSPYDTVCTEANFNLYASVVGGNGGYVYTWNNGLPNSSFHTVRTKNSNVYTVSVTDAKGCPGVIDSVIITVNHIYLDSVNAWSTNDVCLGESTTLYATYSGGSGTYTFDWSHGLGTGGGPIVVSPVAATIYQVTVTDECKSKVTDFVIVNMLQSPVISTPTIIDEGCGPLTVQFSDNVTNTGTPTYLWDFGDGNTSTDQNPIHTYTQAGTYNITIVKSSDLGCSATSKGNSVVKVFPFPEAIGDADKYLANVSNALINFTDNSIGAITREWTFAPNQFSNLENAFYTFNDTGSYEVTLKVNNSYGCVAFDTLIILVETSNKFNVPNAFTPNTGGGNGGTYDPNSFSNEVFFPRMELVDQYHLLIFNRWGEIVFESNDVNIGWDGYYKDRLSPQDAYVWKIEATFEDGTQLFKVGDLTLLR